MKKALFLDRDGTINKTVKKHSVYYNELIDDTPFTLSELKFNEGIKELVEKAKKLGYEIIVITNQPSIIRGESKIQNYEEITKKICQELKIQRSHVFECFHREPFSLECNCRKPKPGLILMAKGMFDIDLEKSLVLGDSWKDIAAGQTAGLGKRIFLRRKINEFQFGNKGDEKIMKEKGVLPDYIVNDLNEFSNILEKI